MGLPLMWSDVLKHVADSCNVFCRDFFGFATKPSFDVWHRTPHALDVRRMFHWEWTCYRQSAHVHFVCGISHVVRIHARNADMYVVVQISGLPVFCSLTL